MSKVLISGGSGNVGTRLTTLLQEKGYKVAILSTRKSYKHPTAEVFYWNIKDKFIEEGAFESTNYVIHLAGAGVADARWTEARKKEIYDSRIDTTKLFYKYLNEKKYPLKAFISTSAIGIYQKNTNEVLFETTPPANNFLAKVCIDWEAEAQKISKLDIRVAIIRTGIVLDKNGGALKEMLKTAPAFLSTLGDGSQIYSWIHVEDLCQMYLHLIEKNSAVGAYNGVAPKAVSQKAMMQSIKKSKYSLAPILPAPAFVLKIALGEMSEVVLGSQNCSAEKILATGFQFQFPDIDSAVGDLL